MEPLRLKIKYSQLFLRNSMFKMTEVCRSREDAGQLSHLNFNMDYNGVFLRNSTQHAHTFIDCVSHDVTTD